MDHGIRSTKQTNEISVMKWLEGTSLNTLVPQVVRYCVDQRNSLERPFTIIGHRPGVSADKVYDQLHDDDKRGLVGQLARVMEEMFNNEIEYIGGGGCLSSD